MTATGSMGSPEYAEPEKGEALLKAATGEIKNFLSEFKTWKYLEGNPRSPF